MADENNGMGQSQLEQWIARQEQLNTEHHQALETADTNLANNGTRLDNIAVTVQNQRQRLDEMSVSLTNMTNILLEIRESNVGKEKKFERATPQKGSMSFHTGEGSGNGVSKRINNRSNGKDNVTADHQKVIGKLRPYENKDRTLWPAFRSLLEAKLTIDGENGQIGANSYQQIWFLLSKLDDKARKLILPWEKEYRNDPVEYTVEKCLEYMDSHFMEHNAKGKALTRLNTWNQGSRDFNEFLSTFMDNLLTAGGIRWEDEIKIGYLKKAISEPLKVVMVGKNLDGVFANYVDQLKRCWNDLQEVKGKNIFVGQSPGGKRNSNGSNGNIGSSAQTDQEMDWEPERVQVNSTVAKWVSPDTIQKRRDRNQCLRCGGPNHRIASCPLDPPVRPQSGPRPGGNNAPGRAAQGRGGKFAGSSRADLETRTAAARKTLKAAKAAMKDAKIEELTDDSDLDTSSENE